MPDLSADAHALTARALNAPLDALRDAVLPEAPLAFPLAAALPEGLALHADPAARMTGRWQSPRGRLLELETRPEAPGGWLALHLALPLTDLAGPGWIGLAVRSAAAEALAIRVALRSGLAEGGFLDSFFDRQILSQPAESDHVDLMAPDRRPDLPETAPWRELVLFLPPDRGIGWALHDLRLFRL